MNTELTLDQHIKLNLAIEDITGTDQFKIVVSPTYHAITVSFDSENRKDDDDAVLLLAKHFIKDDVTIFLVTTRSMKVSMENVKKYLLKE